MKDLIFSIANIFKYAGKIITLIRNFFINSLLLFLLVILIIAFSRREQEIDIPDNAILSLDISGDIVEEKKQTNPLEKLFEDSVLNSPEPETALQDILDTINMAAGDERISAILLNLKDMGHSGINQLRTIGSALTDFRETGKMVIAAEDYYTQSQYLLASYGNTILLNPMGAVDIHGLGVFRLYFKDAVEKLEINYNVFKVGSYKSALEPFTRNSMSLEDQQQNELWLSALWSVYTEEISRQRDISLNSIDYYTDNIVAALSSTKGDTARLALDIGLVDKIVTRSEKTSFLANLNPAFGDTPEILPSTEYLASTSPTLLLTEDNKDKVGVIIAEGNILPGKQPPGLIGGDSLARLIQQAREDETINALVLRVNSGGGSAFASEIIRQEILAFKRSGKPFVVSMGSVAASGGYWIAADADQIWAAPATITGSIGIFGAIPTFEKSLESLGIYSDGVGTTPLAAGLDLTQPLPDQLKNIIQQSIDYNYDQFLQIVADGRNLEKSRVAELAQGRVYDGRTAMDLGLVDNLGSLDDALGSAAELAGLTDYQTEYIRPPVSVRDQFLQLLETRLPLLSSASEERLLNNPTIQQLSNRVFNQLRTLIDISDPQGVYARCLVKLTW